MSTIFIVSDGTGRTATQMLQAALTQYPDVQPEVRVRAGLRTREEVLDIARDARDAGALIVHTVVSRELREFILEAGRLNNVETVDLMGPLLAHLSTRVTGTPIEEPGLFYTLNKAYFQRIEAMEFAFRHDDGQRTHELGAAEIVLVGVSRTFKTPLSMFLAFKGWMAANVPIVMGVPLPQILDELPDDRVFGLVTNPRNLTQIRRSRHKHLGGVTTDYIDFEQVKLELMHARHVFADHPGWTIIDVTHKPIEEIAFEILDVLKNR